MTAQASLRPACGPPVELVTLGCRLNAAESETMRALAGEAGLGAAVIVNTCAVTHEAVRQSRQAVRKAARAHPGATLIVTGCAAQLEPESFAAMAEVSRVLGNGEKLQARSFAPAAPRVQVGDVMAARGPDAHPISGPNPSDAGVRSRAPVEVQTGCDHRCTFCIIPYGRGPSRSQPAGAVVERVRALAAAGAQEVVLTGVDLTAWGGDLPGAPSLGALVRRILKLAPGLKRLRLSSLDVIEMDETLFSLVTQEERVAPHLHLSLQHGHDLILKRMKRRHSRAEAVDLCARLKAARPGIALGADLIAGFPTETAEHFEALSSLVEACGLAYLHVFPFSARAGTPAARMPQTPPEVIKARAAALRARGAEALTRHLQRWVGRAGEALVERPGFARLPDFTGVRFTGGVEGVHARLRFTGHDGKTLLGALA